MYCANCHFSLGTVALALLLFAPSLVSAQKMPVSSSVQTKAVRGDYCVPATADEDQGQETVAGGPHFAVKNYKESAFKCDKAPRKETSSGRSDWEVSFAPYVYMTGLSGTVGTSGRTAEINLSFADIVSDLELGLMGALEAQKGRIVILNDILWTKLAEKRGTPFNGYSSAKIGTNLFSWSPELGYRLHDGKRGSFDLVGGIRLTSVEVNLNFDSGTLPGFNVSKRKTWAAPIIGAHGALNVTPKFFLSTVFDVGGGFGVSFAGQYYGGVGYRVTRKVTLAGGYRYLRNNYRDDHGFIFDTAMNGILVGAKFKL